MDALQKFADAYSDYRKKQQRNNLLKTLGILGLGAAGIFGFGKFRSAQIKKLMEQAARKRKTLAGLVGLGVAAPVAAYGLSNMGGDDTDVAQNALSRISGILPGASSFSISNLLGGSAPETSSKPNAVQEFLANLNPLSPFSQGGRPTALSEMPDDIRGFFSKQDFPTALSEMPDDIRGFFSHLGN